MERVNHQRLTACFLLIFFLFLSVGYRILTREWADVDYTHAILANHSGIVTAESQLPFEEKEKEEGENHSTSILDSIYSEFDFFNFTDANQDLPRGIFYDNRCRLPIYLAKRALLI